MTVQSTMTFGNELRLLRLRREFKEARQRFMAFGRKGVVAASYRDLAEEIAAEIAGIERESAPS